VGQVSAQTGARQVAAQAFEIGRRLDVRPHVVSDREAIDACLSFADDHRVVVEPACGASLALAYAGVPALRDREDVLLIVCGGAGVSHADLVAMRDACEDSV
jgi:L-serine/L-threonine ammonia-lyase